MPMIKGRNRLEDLLKEYFDVEALSDFYYCSSCKKSSKKSLKRSELWRNPNYLIVQLKRSQFGRKNSERIRIPVKCLNLKPYFTEGKNLLTKSKSKVGQQCIIFKVLFCIEESYKEAIIGQT